MKPMGPPMALATIAAGLSGCMFMASGRPVAMPDDFVEHVRSNAPAQVRECIVQGLLARWQSKGAVYMDANAYRTVRGETDVVNFAIKQLLPHCTSL
jgi:hypothetical protein